MFLIIWPDFYEMRKCPFSVKKEIIGPKDKNSESQEFFFGNLKNPDQKFRTQKFRPISEQKYIDTFVALKSWLGGLAAILFAF